ncbi:MAG: hypothetical protein CVU95_16310 [Firmicutes bacterium HGW-Firmicutes-2]|jgi:hypothetical protein|nr:MAG: hypothetical protein CVU95_16310 [Firmicutes bacterium HGW-Firmicutes-2]
MEILIGHTGFVGSNLAIQHQFDAEYNSSNITQAFGTNPDFCVYAGVRAEKFLAVKYPEADKDIILNAINNIRKINPTRLVLISTIDVYPNPVGVNEECPIIGDTAKAYGYNRRFLEKWVQENIKKHLIVRLPALFGKNLKKNFVYDLTNIVPALLSSDLFADLSSRESLIRDCYELQNNGFYKLSVDETKKKKLRKVFESLGFSALNFTDSRASFQFYNLEFLWKHIHLALENGLSLVNFAVEPITVADVYKNVRGIDFFNEINSNVVRYDIKSIHASLFKGTEGYIFRKEKVMYDICEFIRNEDRRIG